MFSNASPKEILTVIQPRPQPAPRPIAARPPIEESGHGRRSEPFRCAEEAWFWTMKALMARREGARYTANQGLVPRPCVPDDVVRCLDTLYRRRRIDLVHARILRIWGERGIAPNPGYAGERCDARLWREAIDRLEWPLRVKGIVA